MRARGRYYTTMAVVLVSLLLAIAPLVAAARRWGKRGVLASMCAIEGLFMFVCFLVPPGYEPLFVGLIASSGV